MRRGRPNLDESLLIAVFDVHVVILTPWKLNGRGGRGGKGGSVLLVCAPLEGAVHERAVRPLGELAGKRCSPLAAVAPIVPPMLVRDPVPKRATLSWRPPQSPDRCHGKSPGELPSQPPGNHLGWCRGGSPCGTLSLTRVSEPNPQYAPPRGPQRAARGRRRRGPPGDACV